MFACVRVFVCVFHFLLILSKFEAQIGLNSFEATHASSYLIDMLPVICSYV